MSYFNEENNVFGPMTRDRYDDMIDREYGQRPAITGNSQVDGSNFSQTGENRQTRRMDNQWGFPRLQRGVFDAPVVGDARSNQVGANQRSDYFYGNMPSAFAGNQGQRVSFDPSVADAESENQYYQDSINFGIDGIDGTPNNDQIQESWFAQQDRLGQALGEMQFADGDEYDGVYYGDMR